jgi:hypothetical protein
MKDPNLVEKTNILKLKINEINTLLKELHSSEVLVSLSSSKINANDPTQIQLVNCSENVDYLKN